MERYFLLKINDEMRFKVKKLAVEEKTNMSKIICKAVKIYLKWLNIK
jgi:hypothetical protein|tara:strand:+ start:967 stop:1107 length:141 start_codon:yes stop_codon:yes gene_type:complete